MLIVNMAQLRFLYRCAFSVVLMLYCAVGTCETFGAKGARDSHTPFPTLNDDKQLQEGQLNYNLALRDSRLPRYGSCWKDALKRLEHGCKHLTDDVQRTLALHFANCFLAKAGQETYPCEDGADISVCLSKMNSNGFTAFSNFFTHTQSMCYFLQSQAWQEETENTVARLSENSMKVAQTLEDSHELQDSILEAQRQSLLRQEQLLQSSSLLSEALDVSKDNVRDMLEEFRSSTSEQRNLIFEVFDRLSKLQTLVLGEVSGFYSLIFYPTALLTVYLLTSTSRTAAARFWLFVTIGCSLALERFVVHITIADGNGYLPADEASEEMYWRIWLIRKGTMLFCSLLLGVYAYKFQDYNKINNTLLMQIQRQNLELKNYLEVLGKGGMPSMKLLSSDVIDALDKKILKEESSDSDFSYDSDASDGTYVPSSCDEDTFETACSRPPSLAPSPDVFLPLLPSIKKEEKPDRPSSRSSQSRSNMPAPVLSPYNLRSRSTPHSASTSLNSESPGAFGQKVKEMERIARRNTKLIIASAHKSKPSYYSSDDD